MGSFVACLLVCHFAYEKAFNSPLTNNSIFL
jgi:hypothetical protein